MTSSMSEQAGDDHLLPSTHCTCGMGMTDPVIRVLTVIRKKPHTKIWLIIWPILSDLAIVELNCGEIGSFGY